MLALCLKILISNKRQVGSQNFSSPTNKNAASKDFDPNETIEEEDLELNEDIAQTSNKRLRLDAGPGSVISSPSIRRSPVEYSQKYVLEQLERQLIMQNSKIHQQTIQAKCLTWLKIVGKLIDVGTHDLPGFNSGVEDCLMVNAVSKFDTTSKSSTTTNGRQTTDAKIRSDLINKMVCSILAKLRIEAANYAESDLVHHALAYSQFDLVLQLSRNDKTNCELVVRKFLGLSGEILDPNYLHLLAQIRLEFLDHETKLRLADHLLRIEFITVDADKNLLDSLSKILVKMIRTNSQTNEQNKSNWLVSDQRYF